VEQRGDRGHPDEGIAHAGHMRERQDGDQNRHRTQSVRNA
jgi:hypothetical protein